NQVNPELAPRLETEDKFLPQTVPGYSAREVFENLRSRPEYKQFFYKEATLNPTNLRDLADKFETSLVEGFRTQPDLKEQTGFRSLAGKDIFYIARPISVSKESCLRCHGNPNDAPRSQILTYGDRNGYNWELGEIVGAQIISVPASKVLSFTRRLEFVVIATITIFLLLAIVVIDIILRMSITQPLRRMSQWAKKISTGNMSEEFIYHSKDEIGILAASLNRMKVSLEMALKMLESQSKSR
ncbi:MAG: DUF3365 domain-containing protein, partial [Prochloraceae cyanobacterium]